MNILVCISRVPDTATRVEIGSDGKSINNNGVKYILNPYDEYALEEGLRLFEKNGGEVTVCTVGSELSVDILRTSLAMGAEKAIHIKADEFALDSFAIAKNLASTAKNGNFDIVLLGRQSIDFDSFQIVSMIGEMLEIPSVSMVSKLDINGTNITGERDIEGGKELFETTLPVVISVQKGINEPRYPKLPQIMKAKSKPIDARNLILTDKHTSVLSMEIPAKQRVGKILTDSDSDINELVRLLREEAKVI